MEKQREIREQINNMLRERLELADCVKGRFECSMPGTSVMISMYGIKQSTGKSFFFWDWENSQKRLIRQYFEGVAPELVSCIIEVNLKENSFLYKTFDRKEYDSKLEQERKDKEKEQMESKLSMKKELAAKTNLYGNTLAEQVANTLQPGCLIAYTHRDYCGMGIGRNESGEYTYGSVWDGWLQVEQLFPTKEAFIEWLSKQSDASLANLDGDVFAWGNQVINRKRLEEFIEYNRNR